MFDKDGRRLAIKEDGRRLELTQFNSGHSGPFLSVLFFGKGSPFKVNKQKDGGAIFSLEIRGI